MDKIDRKIVTLLEQDASIKNWELAEKVALAPSSCLRRVKILKRRGVIRKIVAVTDPALKGQVVQANILVWFADHKVSATQRLIAQLKNEPGINALQSISGQADLLVSIGTETMDDMKDFCDRRFANDPLVVKYETMFVFRDHLQ